MFQKSKVGRAAVPARLGGQGRPPYHYLLVFGREEIIVHFLQGIHGPRY
jgi:hypothetical protein